VRASPDAGSPLRLYPRCAMGRPLLVAAGLAVAGVCWAAGASATAVDVVVTQRLAGATVRLRPGAALLVRLPSNPSTGYSWAVRRRGGPVLSLLRTRYVPPPATHPPRVGVSGRYEARFRALRAGTARLLLVYRRHTTPATPPARRFALRVVVGG
jgi:inhibitor of cysteine peptidase